MNRWTKRLMLQTAYCAVGIVAVLASFGVFEYRYKPNWYIFFTNLSNYFCLGLVVFQLRETLNNFCAEYNQKHSRLAALGAVYITVTMIIYYTVIAPDPSRKPARNWTPENLMLHSVMPILYLWNWLCSFRPGTVGKWMPIQCLLGPAVYAVLIMTRARYITKKALARGEMRYPYFFMDIKKIGLERASRWAVFLLGTFFLVGCVVYVVDRIRTKKD